MRTVWELFEAKILPFEKHADVEAGHFAGRFKPALEVIRIGREDGRNCQVQINAWAAILPYRMPRDGQGSCAIYSGMEECAETCEAIGRDC